MPGIYHKLLYFHVHNMILRIIYTDVLPFYFTCYHNRVFIYNTTREKEGNKVSHLCSPELLTWDVRDRCKSWDIQERIKRKREYVKLMREFNSHGEIKPLPIFLLQLLAESFAGLTMTLDIHGHVWSTDTTRIWSLSKQLKPEHCKMLVFPHMEKSNNKKII